MPKLARETALIDLAAQWVLVAIFQKFTTFGLNKIMRHSESDQMCQRNLSTVRPKSINAVSRANFGIVIGVHPSTLQIKKK